MVGELESYLSVCLMTLILCHILHFKFILYMPYLSSKQIQIYGYILMIYCDRFSYVQHFLGFAN